MAITPGTLHASQVSHAARGPEPPPANVNTVDANRDGGEGGDRERGGGEAASVEMNMSLEDTLQFIMETVQKTTLTVLDLQKQCALLCEGKIAQLFFSL